MSRRFLAEARVGEVSEAKSKGRKAGILDAEIGRRIRLGRSKRRITQEQLASEIGISCQQLQKYEVGINRISVVRLIAIANALEVRPSALLSESGEMAANVSPVPDANGAETLVLLNAFYCIRNIESRTKLIEMAQFLANLERASETRT